MALTPAGREAYNKYLSPNRYENKTRGEIYGSNSLDDIITIVTPENDTTQAYVSDLFKNSNDIINTKISTKNIITRFEKTVENLNDVFSVDSNKNGQPIYSTWIKFQMGKTENAILFNSQSNKYEQNLIASLNITKGSNGFANIFTLDIYYDAFKNGQETNQATAEVLDEWVATALSYDFSSNPLDTNDSLKGYIQYGYNQLDDTDKELYTPIYEFYLTDASAETQFNSGITHYVFKGVSYISCDINFTANIDAQKGRPLNIVKRILIKYYGKNEAPFDGVSPDDNAFDYKIDISDTLLTEQQNEEIEKEAVTMNPLEYCKTILDKYTLNQSELDSKETDEVKEKINQIKYILYITDEEDERTIHVTHVGSSKYGETCLINYQFDWSNTNNNIVTAWSATADLKQFLINSAVAKRYNYDLQNYQAQLNELQEKYNNAKTDEKRDINNEIIYVASKILTMKTSDEKEYYHAELQTVGIPTDIPIGGIIRIKPVVFQSVSRTSGIYEIMAAEDTIETNGKYITTFKLYRLDSLDNWDKYSG